MCSLMRLIIYIYIYIYIHTHTYIHAYMHTGTTLWSHTGTLTQVNEIAKICDKRFADLIAKGEYAGIISVSCDARVNGVNASALAAAAEKDVPVCVCMHECTCMYICMQVYYFGFV